MHPRAPRVGGSRPRSPRYADPCGAGHAPVGRGARPPHRGLDALARPRGNRRAAAGARSPRADEPPRRRWDALDAPRSRGGLAVSAPRAPVPRLIELQGFPSLSAFEVLQADAWNAALEGLPGLPRGTWSPYFSGFDRAGFLDLFRRTVLGDVDPAEVVLLDLEPDAQKTAIDFAATRVLLGVDSVDPRALVKEGRRLFRDVAGRRVPVRRIYNRIVFDELIRTGARFRSTSATTSTSAGAAPELVLTWSKASLPLLAHPAVPKATVVSAFARAGRRWRALRPSLLLVRGRRRERGPDARRRRAHPRGGAPALGSHGEDRLRPLPHSGRRRRRVKVEVRMMFFRPDGDAARRSRSTSAASPREDARRRLQQGLHLGGVLRGPEAGVSAAPDPGAGRRRLSRRSSSRVSRSSSPASSSRRSARTCAGPSPRTCPVHVPSRDDRVRPRRGRRDGGLGPHPVAHARHGRPALPPRLDDPRGRGLPDGRDGCDRDDRRGLPRSPRGASAARVAQRDRDLPSLLRRRPRVRRVDPRPRAPVPAHPTPPHAGEPSRELARPRGRGLPRGAGRPAPRGGGDGAGAPRRPERPDLFVSCVPGRDGRPARTVHDVLENVSPRVRPPSCDVARVSTRFRRSPGRRTTRSSSSPDAVPAELRVVAVKRGSRPSRCVLRPLGRRPVASRERRMLGFSRTRRARSSPPAPRCARGARKRAGASSARSCALAAARGPPRSPWARARRWMREDARPAARVDARPLEPSKVLDRAGDVGRDTPPRRAVHGLASRGPRAAWDSRRAAAGLSR